MQKISETALIMIVSHFNLYQKVNKFLDNIIRLKTTCSHIFILTRPFHVNSSYNTFLFGKGVALIAGMSLKCKCWRIFSVLELKQKFKYLCKYSYKTHFGSRVLLELLGWVWNANLHFSFSLKQKGKSTTRGRIS